ncbi:restriction endonuclease subunit S, partial [Mycoplasma zalophi]|uniref:restriction endonuclease subunit S n=1 Tax=Mycoplasma zalophi TaxID=191287 RepID=UPI0021C5F7C6
WFQDKTKNLYNFASEGGTPNSTNKIFYEKGKIPFVKINDTKNKYIYETEFKINSLGLKNSSAWIIPKNNILLTNGATIGNISINKVDLATKQGIIGMIINSNYFVEFVYYLLKSDHFQKSLFSKVSVGTFANVILQQVAEINIKVPDKKEQEKISNTFNLFDTSISLL